MTNGSCASRSFCTWVIAPILISESKTRRRAFTPFRVRGDGVRPVERRIDLCAVELARVALEMRACRVEADADARGIDQPAVPTRCLQS